MKHIIAAVLVLLPLAACTPSETADTSTGSSVADTVDEAQYDDEIQREALEFTWSIMSGSEQVLLCEYFNADRAEAWDAFDVGAGGTISEAEFIKFFSGRC